MRAMRWDTPISVIRLSKIFFPRSCKKTRRARRWLYGVPLTLDSRCEGITSVIRKRAGFNLGEGCSAVQSRDVLRYSRGKWHIARREPLDSQFADILSISLGWMDNMKQFATEEFVNLFLLDNVCSWAAQAPRCWDAIQSSSSVQA